MTENTFSNRTIEYLDSIEELFVAELSKTPEERLAGRLAKQSAEQTSELQIEEPPEWLPEQPEVQTSELQIEQPLEWLPEQPEVQTSELQIEQPLEWLPEQPEVQTPELQIEEPSEPLQSEAYTPSVWRELSGLAIKIAVICIAFVLIFTFLYGLHRSADPDMEPMIKTGDLILFYRLDRNYSIGDLMLLDFQGERQVRRVVANAGDTVDITEGSLVVNGSIQQEPEIFQETWQYENGISFPLTVGADQVFVLGDARESAIDSRVYGPVNVEDTLGTVITIIRRRGF